jgi:hypothetical protein
LVGIALQQAAVPYNQPPLVVYAPTWRTVRRRLDKHTNRHVSHVLGRPTASADGGM